jgi:transcriptional regulator with XRE-family HTH domain
MAEKKLKEIIGKNIAWRRRLLNMTQDELGEKIGIVHESVCRMEQGGIAPKLERLPVFAQVLGCTVEDLLRTQDDKVDTQAAVIASMLHGLSPENRRVLLGTVTEMARLLRLNAEDNQ